MRRLKQLEERFCKKIILNDFLSPEVFCGPINELLLFNLLLKFIYAYLIIISFYTAKPVDVAVTTAVAAATTSVVAALLQQQQQQVSAKDLSKFRKLIELYFLKFCFHN